MKFEADISIMTRRFFILGCQRSGTTLLRLILEVHPNIFCFDETQSYSILQNASVPELSGSPLVGFKIPRWTEQILCDELSDDGPEGSCANFYKNEKILFMIRDVRDAVTSMFNLRLGESNWCELWVPRIIAKKIKDSPAFLRTYAEELQLIEHSGNRMVGLAALYWKYKTNAFFTYREEGLPVAPISYENLVKNPALALKHVCMHLEVAFDDNLLHHNDFSHTETYTNGLTVGGSDPKAPIKETSVGQWKKFFNNRDLDLISRIVSDMPDRCSRIFTESPAIPPPTLPPSQ